MHALSLTLWELKYANNQGAFAGEWKDNAKHGWGERTYSDGGVFIGKWENGKKRRGKYRCGNKTANNDEGDRFSDIDTEDSDG